MAVPDLLKPVPALLEEMTPAAGAPAPFGETDFLDPLLGGPEPAERHGRDVTLLEDVEAREPTAETADAEAPGEPESLLPPPTIAFSGAETAGLAVDGDHLFLITSFVEALELLGTAAANAVGNANANTITGNEGANAIWGGGGDDFLYGAGGEDLLAGGEGDDVYVFYGGESDFDVVADTLGTNSARLEGFTATTEAIGGVDGSGDLTVFVHDPAASFVLFQPLFRVEGYSASPDSFAGVEIGGLFVTTDDLLA